MTNNQISYTRFLEDQRHNYVAEALQARSIAEIERHNVVQESQGWRSILETERHNRAGESLGWAQFNETKRHNMAGENLGWANYYESVRHNKAGEAYNMSYLNELARHNLSTESIQQMQASTAYQRYLEEVRHNQANEALGYASNPWAYLTNPEAISNLVSSWTSVLGIGGGASHVDSSGHVTGTLSNPNNPGLLGEIYNGTIGHWYPTEVPA